MTIGVFKENQKNLKKSGTEKKVSARNLENRKEEKSEYFFFAFNVFRLF